jgi:hypothetical protein
MAATVNPCTSMRCGFGRTVRLAITPRRPEPAGTAPMPGAKAAASSRMTMELAGRLGAALAQSQAVTHNQDDFCHPHPAA